MTRHSIACVAALAALSLGAATASAQDSRFGTEDMTPQGAAPGWTATPSILYSGSWDDNVLLHGRGDSAQSDFLNVMNPRGDVEFNGQRTQFLATYDGAFLMYRDFNTLDSFDQHGGASFRRVVSKHVTAFFSDSLSIVPTTELSLLVGIPFLRTGSRVNDFRGGVEAFLSKRSSITTSYHSEWVQFDALPEFPQLRGGHTEGGALGFRRQMTLHTAFTADTDFEHATVGIGDQTFDVTNAGAGFEHSISDVLRIAASVGISRLGVTPLNPSRIGPMLRAHVTRQIQSGALDVSYSRSYVPAFGFGGTTDNKDLTVRLRMPLARRVYSESSVSWRTNDPVVEGALSLRSWWVQSTVGYTVQPWVRLEGFFGTMQQTIDRPGGDLERTRFGFQIVTGKPMRVR